MIGPFRTGDFLVGESDLVGALENAIDRFVELSAPVNVPHPVALDFDAELVEHRVKLSHVEIGHVTLSPARGRRIAERTADVLAEMFILALGNFIDGIVIVGTEEVPGFDAFAAQGLENGVVNEHSAQRAHVNAPARRLRVIDDLRPLHAGGDFFSPKHRARTDSQFDREVEAEVYGEVRRAEPWSLTTAFQVSR